MDDANGCDAIQYANALSVSEGLTPAYALPPDATSRTNWDSCNRAAPRVRWNPDADGYRLPTEAEWEFAARAGTTDALGGQALEDVAWTDESGIRVPAAVATKRPNVWGLYDMLGNVREWTWDVGAACPTGDARDPAGPDLPPPDPADPYPKAAWRIARGGSVYDAVANVNVTRRGHKAPAGGGGGGIRLVRNAPTDARARENER